MNETPQDVLNQLQKGQISSKEADYLLTSINQQSSNKDGEPLTGEILSPRAKSPDFKRFQQFWRIPFAVSAAFLLLFGLWLRALYQASEGAISFGYILLWVCFMVALVATAVSFMSRQSPWLHIRIKPKKGPRIKLSLPLPIRIASTGLRFAKLFVPSDEKSDFHMANDFLNSAQEEFKDGKIEDPLFIDIDDAEGNHVQLFLG